VREDNVAQLMTVAELAFAPALENLDRLKNAAEDLVS